MSRIIKMGSYLPQNKLSNLELIEKFQIDSSDEWIQQRTGIDQRYFADHDEEVSHLAIKAAKDLVDQMDHSIASEIKTIIVASMSSKQPTPSVANQVSLALNCEDAFCLDINTACSGFVSALELAEHLSSNQATGYTLVIGAEKMSQILDANDRSTNILFGDGAGAFLIEHDGTGLLEYQSAMHSEGDLSLSIEVSQATNFLMQMKGREVFNFVSRKVIPSLIDFIHENAIEMDYLICHQANQRFLDLIAKKMSMDELKLPSNIKEVANLSAASIPVLCHQLVKNKQLKLDGTQTIVLCGFGAGLSWGNITLKI
ncbi:beta-ketoacyl-ACP synthase 3 [Globicatella sanguinis]|uniref:beta-ketoacyl-ACP synthase 3 n=1 Tax=Globicatella sanguinis TaxID=13076 RepID=UPI000825D2FF|nr:beta-ketoacyl-ACP synthase 3 [Globicatella sanguinis]